MGKSRKIEISVGEDDLSWNLKDYQDHGKEPPRRIKNHPLKTEGELMSEEEIKDWFLESLSVLKVLKEDDNKVFLKVHKGFILDLEYLFSLDKIREEVLDFAHDIKNFDF